MLKGLNIVRPAKLTIFFFLLLGVVLIQAQNPSESRVNVRIVTDEADAVLLILAKQESRQEITEGDWQRVFSSEGYVRLKKRELSLKRPFDDAAFKDFILSKELVARRQALADTLARWKEAQVDRVAMGPLAYLPRNAQIKAKIYPVIKPQSNSFVFEISEDPAIFLYLDPAKSREVFENEFAHELHHIGYSTACPTEKSKDELKKLSPSTQKVFGWIGAFGEGFAMVAAVGSPDIHPHSASPSADRERWDKDLANFDSDVKTLEKFFLDVANRRLTEADERQTAFSFFGVQGPWYTVGWQMAVIIEKTFGRKKLIDCICDRQLLLPTYNRAVKEYSRKNNKQLATWSEEFLVRVRK